MQVPLLDLRAQYLPLKSQFLAEIEAVCDSQQLVLGPKTEAFEKAAAHFCGAEHCIGVSSGTDAQLLLLMAMEIGPCDVVVTTPFTFFSTAGCIQRVGAQIVFADIDPVTFNMCPISLERALKRHPNARAIAPVHLYGCCANMDAILELGRKYRVPVIEDAAQAFGAHHPLGAAGTMGHAGWFSFYPTKNMGAFGDAGMVVCDDDKLAERMRALRNHGMEPRYYHNWVGGNFRIDALQSAVLSVKLPHLNTWSAARKAHADRYRAGLTQKGLASHVTLPAEPWAESGVANHHIYNQFVIRAPKRDELRAFLATAQISTEVYYPVPLHLQKCFLNMGWKPGAFPESERAALETLALPVYPELTDAQIDYVIDRIAYFYSRN